MAVALHGGQYSQTAHVEGTADDLVDLPNRRISQPAPRHAWRLALLRTRQRCAWPVDPLQQPSTDPLGLLASLGPGWHNFDEIDTPL